MPTKIPTGLRAWSLLLFALTAVFGSAAGAQGIDLPLRTQESSDAPIAETVRLYSRSYALVIGNDAYTGSWPRLSNAVKDAQLVAEAMEAKGFTVTLKTDLNSRELEEAIESFFLETGDDPDARLFLWYAGHGYSERGEGYLVPVDALDPSEGGRFRRSAFSLRRMGEYARGSEALHILAVFDSCFAGTIFTVGRAKPPPAITHATTRPVRQFLTSGDAGQEVSDDGTFRKLFIRAINGENRADANRDGYLAASELGLYMTNEITNYSNGNQTPRNGKLNDPDLNRGDFVFQLPTAPAAAPAPSAEILFWQSIRESRNPADFQAYLDQFPAGTFAALARNRLTALAPQESAALKPPPATAPPADVPPRPQSPGSVYRDCNGCPEMIALPPGSFGMGDATGRSNESPVRNVSFARPFAIGKYEVTRGEFARFVDATGLDPGNGCYVFDGTRWQEDPGKSWRDPGFAQTDRDPVTCVTWDDARTYAKWLRDSTGRRYRLLSEAEWEYAARAGGTGRYAFGNDPAALCQAGNGADRGAPFGWANQACSDGFAAKTAPVGSFASNEFGLFDMHGNLWEWVADCWNPRYDRAPADGSPWISRGDCAKRVLRGGSWDSRPDNLRSAFRTADRRDARYNFVGFRVASDL